MFDFMPLNSGGGGGGGGKFVPPKTKTYEKRTLMDDLLGLYIR